MTIEVYSRKGCGICDAAKEKLGLLGFPYRSFDMERFTEFHEGWRDDGSVDLIAAYAMFDSHLPLIRIDGAYFDYPGAMGRLRQAGAAAEARPQRAGTVSH